MMLCASSGMVGSIPMRFRDSSARSFQRGRDHFQELHGASFETANEDGDNPEQIGVALGVTAFEQRDQATCVQIEKHLAACARCAGACDALKRAVSLCRVLPGDVVPTAVWTAVRGAIMAAISTSSRVDRWIGWHGRGSHDGHDGS
jgi:hypothetical protein